VSRSVPAAAQASAVFLSAPQCVGHDPLRILRKDFIHDVFDVDGRVVRTIAAVAHECPW
jgi:hypothetical protein